LTLDVDGFQTRFCHRICSFAMYPKAISEATES
jgi:hypothetical protein